MYPEVVGLESVEPNVSDHDHGHDDKMYYGIWLYNKSYTLIHLYIQMTCVLIIF